MSNHIDFYFDIISPYAYIAYKKILKIKNFDFKLLLLETPRKREGCSAQGVA